MAIKYIPYYPNTLDGQAILNNFVRTQRVLRYRDNDKVVERIQRGMPLYEMETIEQVGDNPDPKQSHPWRVPLRLCLSEGSRCKG